MQYDAPIKELYAEPMYRMREEGGFAALPNGINVKTANYVAQTMRQVTADEDGDFTDRNGHRISVPKGEHDKPLIHEGYAHLIWDFMHGNVLLGRSVQGRDILYVRDMDKGDMRGRFEGDRYIPFQPSTWHALNITMDYHIPKSQAQMQAAWDMQMMFECRRLRLRVIHGIRFRNAVFMRDNFDPDHFDKPISRIVKRGPEYDKFNWPYELTLDYDYSPEVSMQARKFLEFVTEPDGRTLMDGTPGDASHSADNLTRYFATPLLEEYKHLTYVLYGGGGNGKGILMQSFTMTPGLENGMCASIDSMKLLGGKQGAGGFSTDQEALKLKTALWAYDEEAADITLQQMTNLKRISTGDMLTARRIQENAVDIWPKAVFAICTNNPVITTMTPASRRRFVFVRMRDGRSPREFDELRRFRAKYGAAGFIMASCDLWLKDNERPEDSKDFWDDVTIGSADDLNQAEEWMADQIVRFGYAPPSNPYRQDMADHKNSLAKLGLVSKTKRITVEGSDKKQVKRVLIVGDETRFAPYRAAIEKQWREGGVERFVEPDKPVREDTAPADELPDVLPNLREQMGMDDEEVFVAS